MSDTFYHLKIRAKVPKSIGTLKGTGFILKIVYGLILTLILGCSHYSLHRKVASESHACSTLIKKLLRKTDVHRYDLHSTIGVEFEGVIPKEITYRYVASFISSHIEKNFKGSNVIISSEDDVYLKGSKIYKVKFSHNDYKYEYTIKSDPSVTAETGFRGIEITSPILRDDFDVNFHIWILNKLKMIGLEQKPNVGGIHIHYGLPEDLVYEKLMVFYRAFYKMRRSIKRKFYVNQGRGFINEKKLLEAIEEIEKVIKNAPNTKVFKVPLEKITERSLIRVLTNYKTIEARFFNSSLNDQILWLSIDFFNKFAHAVVSGDKKLLAYVENHKEIDIFKVSRIVRANLHKQKDLLRKLKDDNVAESHTSSFSEALSENSLFELPVKVFTEIKTDVELLYYLKDKESFTIEKIYSLIDKDFFGPLSQEYIVKYLRSGKLDNSQASRDLLKHLLAKEQPNLFIFFDDPNTDFIQSETYHALVEALKLKKTKERDVLIGRYLKKINDESRSNSIHGLIIKDLHRRFRFGPLAKFQYGLYKLLSEKDSLRVTRNIRSLFRLDMTVDERSQELTIYLQRLAQVKPTHFKKVMDVLYSRKKLKDYNYFFNIFFEKTIYELNKFDFLTITFLAKMFYEESGSIAKLVDCLKYAKGALPHRPNELSAHEKLTLKKHLKVLRSLIKPGQENEHGEELFNEIMSELEVYTNS